MTPSGVENTRLIRQQQFGFWIGTKQAPRRAVRWEKTFKEDGRETLRGKNWVEILPHGESRTPERFFAADVELIGPHEWLEYYPAVDEPVCGWGRPRLPEGEMQYCPRTREESEPFCRTHMAELSEERNPHAASPPGPDSDGESVPSAL